MAWHLSISYSQLPLSFSFFRKMFFRQHADISANPDDFFAWDSVGVESSAIKHNKVSSLHIKLEAVWKRLFRLVLFRNKKPIFFEIQHAFILKVFLVVEMWFGHNYKPTLILSWGRQTHDSLIAPNIVSCRRLIRMKRSVYWSCFIVS